MSRFLRKATAVVFSSVAIAAGSVSPVSATPYDGEDDTISAWAPRHYYTIMSNAPGHYDVIYYFKFTEPDESGGAMRSTVFDPYPHTEVATLELGFKDTGHHDCRFADSFLQVGIPSASNAQVDYSEDSTDAVLWMSSLNDIREDQEANPTKDYLAAWTCDTGDDFRSNPAGEIGPYQIQLGYSLFAPPTPGTTFAERTFNMIPQEEADRAIPAPGDDTSFHFAFDAPWVRAWNFEASLTPWTTWQASLAQVSDDTAVEGDSYVHIVPQDLEYSSMIQGFRIRGSGGEGGQQQTGTNTGFTFQSYFRCPTWAPLIRLSFTGYCPVAVWLNSQSNADWEGHEWHIPADGEWYNIEDETWGAQLTDDDVEVEIDTMGYHLEVDGVWVSSGL